MSLSFDAGRGSALLVRDVQGVYRRVRSDEILDAARRVLARRVRRGTVLTDSQVVRDYLRMKLADLEHEVFVVLLLDMQHRLIDYVELFRGTIDSTEVHPREVVKVALAKNAAAVLIAHNHPSGVAEPSMADRVMTARLAQALALVDVRVLDHFIVGDGDVMSFAERGML